MLCDMPYVHNCQGSVWPLQKFLEDTRSFYKFSKVPVSNLNGKSIKSMDNVSNLSHPAGV